MLRTNTLKARLQEGHVAIGVLLLMPDPSLVELVGICGFDYVVVDGEHGALTPDKLEHVVRACDSVALPSIVRLRAESVDAMLPWIDTGVLGVMQPHTRNADDAMRLVNGTKYAPLGTRGMGTGRASAYGSIHGTRQVEEWNREMLAIAQIENVEGVENLDEILRVDGLDACYIGATDLSHAVGRTGEPSHPAVRELQAELAGRVKAAGKWVGFGARDPYDAHEGARLRGIGADLFSFNFVGLFLKIGTELLAATRMAAEGVDQTTTG
jgi:4-hydroxy-2-oxoheptanedioate aldolase